MNLEWAVFNVFALLADDLNKSVGFQADKGIKRVLIEGRVS